jgi:hypothetical protein
VSALDFATCVVAGCKNAARHATRADGDYEGRRIKWCDEHRAPPSNLKSRAAVAKVMEKVFDECRTLREAGQREYAHDDSNAFANFEDDADAFGISREMDLLIFANKHWRGVRSWARGHKSQRENVRGRINDLIVYLTLLRAMADESEGKS